MEKGPLMLVLDQAIEAGVFSNNTKPASCLWGDWVGARVIKFITDSKLSNEVEIDDLARFVLTLRTMEEPGFTFTLEEANELIHGFRVSCVLLRMVREGRMVKADNLSLFDPKGSWKLTVDGEEVAKDMIQHLGLEDEIHDY